MIKNVAIVGRGALGVMYAKAFMDALGFDHVFMVADDARIARYQKTKLCYNGAEIKLNYQKASHLKDIDLLIFTVKYHGLKDAMAELKGLDLSHTIVMSFLNGVISEEDIKKELNPQHLLYTTVQGMDATFSDNSLSVSHQGFIRFGNPDLADETTLNNDADIKAVAEVFDRATLKYEICPDIKHQLFSKWMLNVGVNQACAYYEVGYGGLQKEGEPRDAMYKAMREAQAVALSCGVKISDEEMENWVKIVDSLDADAAPSMEQDRRSNRANEVGLFAQTVCDLAKKAHIPTPQNQIFLEHLAKYNA